MEDQLEIILLCKTQPKPSYNFEGDWFKEYAIAPIGDDAAREYYYNKFRYKEIYDKNPFVMLRRRVDVVDGKNKPWDWEPIDFRNGKLNAAASVGDSDYYGGIGIHPLHTKAIELRDREIDLQQERTSLEDYITPNKFERRSGLQKEFYDKRDRMLKEQRLWKKFSENVEDARITAINNQIRAEYKTEHDSYANRIAEIKAELELIEQEIQKGE